MFALKNIYSLVTFFSLWEEKLVVNGLQHFLDANLFSTESKDLISSSD